MKTQCYNLIDLFWQQPNNWEWKVSAQMKYCISHVQKAALAAAATRVLFPLIPSGTHLQFIMKPWKVYDFPNEGDFYGEDRNRSLPNSWTMVIDKRRENGYSVPSWMLAACPFSFASCCSLAFHLTLKRLWVRANIRSHFLHLDRRWAKDVLGTISRPR